MKKLIKTFITKSFIIFCIIGLLNTVIDFLIYNGYRLTNFFDYNEIIATTLAFIIASLFSYFANAKFTYKQKSNKDTFIKSIIVFILKWLLHLGLTLGFNTLFRAIDVESLITFTPIFVTCIVLPLQFIAFNIIFKKKDEIKEDTIDE